MITDFIKRNKLSDDFNKLAVDHYLPLTQRIFKQYKAEQSPYFVGVNGCQGSGKSTLSAFMAEYLSTSLALNVVVMSLDDFYLSSGERNKVAKNIHPLFNTRGVPGTHNITKLKQVLGQLKDQCPAIAIPTFNKATDEPNDKNEWQHINAPVDIIIVEGWCWGVSAQEQSQLSTPINALEQHKDQQGIWRNYVNQQLIEYYQPLYSFINYWVVLQAPSFDCVYRWRLEQEQKLAQSLPITEQCKIMNDTQVLDFIRYFQRLTEHGLKTLAQTADSLFLLDQNRQVNRAIEGKKND
ncbi:MAG: kinase [Colwellia sp.]